MKRKTPIRRYFAFAFVIAATALAQFQTNRQVAAPGASGSVRYSTSYATYASNYTPNYTNNTVLLPSEARNAEWKSGALRSDIRFQAQSVGQLAPNSAYIAPSYELGKSYQKTPYSLGSVRGAAPPKPINPVVVGTPPATPMPAISPKSNVSPAPLR